MVILVNGSLCLICTPYISTIRVQGESLKSRIIHLDIRLFEKLWNISYLLTSEDERDRVFWNVGI
jgi:hypothetical protein